MAHWFLLPGGAALMSTIPRKLAWPGLHISFWVQSSGASLGPALSGFSLHGRVPPCPMSQLFQGQQGHRRLLLLWHQVRAGSALAPRFHLGRTVLPLLKKSQSYAERERTAFLGSWNRWAEPRPQHPSSSSFPKGRTWPASQTPRFRHGIMFRYLEL